MKFNDLLLSEQSDDPFEPLPKVKYLKGTAEELKHLKKELVYQTYFYEARYRQIVNMSDSIRRNFSVQAEGSGELEDAIEKHPRLEKYLNHQKYVNIEVYSQYFVLLNTPQALALQTRVDKIKQQWSTYRLKVHNIKQRVADLTKQLRNQRTLAKADEIVATGGGNASELTTDPTRIPEKLPKMLGMKPTLENPYYISGTHYAGNAEQIMQYLTPTYQKHYRELVAALKRNGLPGFTVMYFGGYGRTNLANFIAYAVDGKFVWRKYDVGRGSAMNYVYAKGIQVTNPLNGASQQRQDEWLRKTFPEYFE